MSKDGRTTSLALLLSGLALGGCATSTAGSSPMDARAEATALPKTGVLQDPPPQREKPTMTADERSKLQKELIAARNRQTSDVKARGGSARPKPAAPLAPVERPQ
jgi:hypothetical protein